MKLHDYTVNLAIANSQQIIMFQVQSTISNEIHVYGIVSTKLIYSEHIFNVRTGFLYPEYTIYTGLNVGNKS